MTELFTLWNTYKMDNLTNKEFNELYEEEKIAGILCKTFGRPVRVFNCEAVPDTDCSVWARVKDYMPYSIEAAGIEADFIKDMNYLQTYNKLINNVFEPFAPPIWAFCRRLVSKEVCSMERSRCRLRASRTSSSIRAGKGRSVFSHR